VRHGETGAGKSKSQRKEAKKAMVGSSFFSRVGETYIGRAKHPFALRAILDGDARVGKLGRRQRFWFLRHGPLDPANNPS